MNITWINHRDILSQNAGGAERTIYEVGRRLVASGNSLTWLSVASYHRFEGFWKDGIKIIRMPGNILAHLALPVLLKRTRADIIVDDLGHAVPWGSQHFTDIPGTVFFRHLHARSLLGQVRPIIAKFITAIEKCYFILYHDIVFVTESTTSRNDLLKLEIKEDEIIMIPPGVDKKLFHPAAKSKCPSMVYFVGMRRYKRPLEVIYLVKSLISKIEDIKLYIIGTGPEEQNLKKLANEFNVQNYVEFKGRISNEELSDIVALSWLNVHTSVTEGWGFSILEASSSGTPTVAYDVPGVKDALEGGLNGIKVNDGNREELANAAFSILKDPERWWSSSVEVANKYSWEKTAELWETLIHEITNNYRKKQNLVN